MSMTEEQLAEFAVEFALSRGADEVEVDISSGSQVSITRRGGEIEEAKESTSRGLSMSVMVDGKYASCQTSDLRPDALKDFIQKAVASAEFLEPDLDRALATLEMSQTTREGEDLDLVDPTQASLTPDERDAYVLNLETTTRDLFQEDVISGAVFYGDGSQRLVRVNSNDFSCTEEGTWFSVGGELSLRDGDKMPEGYAYYSAVHREDLPSIEEISAAIHRNTRDKVGAGPLPSGRYPMLLRSDVVGRIIGMFLGPLSGGSLHKKQSCFLESLGTQVGSEHFTLLSDPTLKRGFRSMVWDGDNLAMYPRTIVDSGVLKSYNIGLYNSRRLGVEPTGGMSNIIVAPGARSDEEILKDFPRCIVVTGFLGGNSNATSGDFSLGISGTLYENGEPTSAVSEMNVSGNLTQVFHNLVEVAKEPWMFSNVRSPSLVFDDITFSGS